MLYRNKRKAKNTIPEKKNADPQNKLWLIRITYVLIFPDTDYMKSAKRELPCTLYAPAAV